MTGGFDNWKGKSKSDTSEDSDAEESGDEANTTDAAFVAHVDRAATVTPTDYDSDDEGELTIEEVVKVEENMKPFQTIENQHLRIEVLEEQLQPLANKVKMMN